jgi:hypothetical protein
MGLDFLVPIFGILIVLVPITGLTVVLTAKYAVRPIVEGLAQLRRDGGYAQPGELQLQIQDLSEQVEGLSREVLRLKEAQAFDQRLLQGEETQPRG